MRNKIFLLALFLLLMHLPSWGQIGGNGYNPNNPGDPGNPVLKYNLTLKAVPTDGGSFNVTTTKVAVDEVYNIRAYPNTGFVFVAWICNGDTISRSASYNITMPNHNVEITGVFKYNPSNPADPQDQPLKYQLSLRAEPVNSGSFNINNERFAVGSTNQLRAYSNTDFVFKHWRIGDSIISTNANYDFVMPAHNVQIIGQFEYRPASPGNPNANYWDKLTGHVIVDYFSPGYLSSAISTILSNNGANKNDVQMITVAGRMNSNDFGIANTYSNCTLLDISRVTGVSEVPSYAFDYTNLESVYLPATVENIGNNAFQQCTKLTSLIVYAMTPPPLGSNVFSGVPEGLVVYVPAAAIPQYQNHAVWGKFIVLPITEDIRNLVVNLPANANPADYTHMWLELTNTKSGQRMHYVMTDKASYKFNNIIRNTTWNVVLRNPNGDIFGQINDVEVKDEDVEVTFASLLKPYTVTLTVKTPQGEDVTSQAEITWTDAEGNFISQEPSVIGLPEGYQLAYTIKLPQELAMAYNLPQANNYTVKKGNNTVTCKLTAIKMVTISGKVKDSKTSIPLSGANVTASQTFGGKYDMTVSTKTDDSGTFSMEIAQVPTVLGAAAKDYISKSVSCDVMSVTTAITLPDVTLDPIAGATISVDFTYTPCHAVGEEAEIQNWYNDYNNVDYAIFNKTKNAAITQFSAQYPQIVLMEDVSDGDVLELTATSRKNAFMPVKATVTIAEQKADATFNVVELGKIAASFKNNSNPAVVGTLYDGDGKLVDTYNYSDATLEISDLADGKYTLVTMGDSRFFNTIYDLTQLPETGLVVGTDYVRKSVDVKSGTISNIAITTVPLLDESKLYFTGENTSFTVNKPSIVIGNYLTMTGHLDFKPMYARKVENVSMIVDIPESCSFVENSVMVGNNTSSYTIDGNKITIPMTYYTDRVRFCVIPTEGGNYAPSAFAQFDIDGTTITQPIGAANYTAQELSINVPSTVAKTSIPVSGTAIGQCSVDIYDNDVLIGQTTSLANGTWATTCELNEPNNLSTHNIYAKVTTMQGLVLNTDIKACTYDMYAIQVSKVVMYHNNPELHKTFEIVFDYQNPSTSGQSYTYYIYNKKFTFTIDFTNNDTTKVTNVVLYVKTAKSGWWQLETTFDQKQGRWIAEGEFGNMYDGDLPVNVSVDYDLLTWGPVSRQALSDAEFDILAIQEEYNVVEGQFDDLANKLETGEISSDEYETLFDELASMESTNANDSIYNDLTLVEILALADKSFQDSNIFLNDSTIAVFANASQFNEFDFSEYGVDGCSLIVKSTEGITIEQLLSRGFEKISIDDGSEIYQLTTDSTYEVVDFVKGTYIIQSFAPEDIQLINSLNANGAFQTLINKINQLKNKCTLLSGIIGSIQSAIDLIPKFFNGKIADIKNSININRIAYRALQTKLKTDLTLTPEQISEIQARITKLKGMNIKLGKQAAKLKRTMTSVMKVAGKITAVLSVFLDGYSLGSNAQKYVNLYYSVPSCPCEPSKSDNLKSGIAWAGVRCAARDIANIVADIASAKAILAGAAAAPVTGGASLLACAGGIALAIGKGCLNLWLDYQFEVERASFSTQINALARDKSCYSCDSVPNPKPEPKPNPSGEQYHGKEPRTVIDPSGYVYEGVPSNRLQGVTATCFYKETVEDMYGDLHDEIVLWDASEYGQENPLYTDENGFYSWDVPQGLWQVKYEKAGYETVYSEWLPVPPPQLDINIAMKQMRQPEVLNARAYPTAVEVEFDKYMIPETLTTDNISVKVNGNTVEGTIQLLNEEVADEDGTRYASRVRFNANQPFDAETVTLHVGSRVKSYAGIKMENDFEQTFNIELEVQTIEVDSLVNMIYGGSRQLTVTVIPAKASKGKTLTVYSSSPMILSVDAETYTLDSKGQAIITVNGELPGMASLLYGIEGYNLTCDTRVNVMMETQMTVATPTASVASGSEVPEGTEVYLHCDTEGATIYYTLDGSCPCDDTPARKVYDGTPIIINGNVTIKAMAVAPGMYESDVVTFIFKTSAIDEISYDAPFKVSPTMVRDGFVVKGNFYECDVMLYSLNGSMVLHNEHVGSGEFVSLGSLNSGVYVAVVTINGRPYPVKIVKM